MESRRFMAVQEHGVTYVRANPAAPFTAGEKARRLAMVVTATLAIASVCLVLAGYGGKESRTSLAAQNAKVAPIFHKTTRLDDETPAADGAAEGGDNTSGGLQVPKFETPDPEEAKKKAAEALNKAR